MTTPQNFRNAFNGFNKDDVVQYLEYINTKHNNQINQLSLEAQELRTQLEKKSQPDEEQLSAMDALRQERDDLAQKLQESEAARVALEAELQQLKSAPAPAPVQEKLPVANEELEAYRRAERTEREAKERAELVYYQANGVLSETTVKVDAIAGEITEMADKVMAQLTQMQMLVSSSKQALQDASSILNTIRPNK